MTRTPVIFGPTASGKTAVAVATALALKESHGISAEIVSADSMLIYRGLDIGSAKPTTEERRGVPHHLIDVVEPDERFTVSDWLTRAEESCKDMRARGALPIVAGGTHLYVKSFIDGLFDGPGEDPEIRSRLSLLDRETLRRKLEEADPVAAERIHPNDTRRTIRALEVFETTGRPISAWQQEWSASNSRDDLLLVALEWETDALNRRINARVRAMLDTGLLDEVSDLHSAGRFGEQSREGLGYKQLVAHLEGDCTLDEAIERIKIETRRFAKNQRTWIRRLVSSGAALRISPGDQPPEEAAQLIISQIFT